MYLDEILVLMTSNWTDNLTRLDQVLIKLQEKGLKCNIEKVSFGQSDMEYLGYWVTHEILRPTEKNIRYSRHGSSNN